MPAALALLVAVCAAGDSAGAGAKERSAPRVLASIVPVHSLVAGVMAGIGEPDLLIDGAASPHSYSLRPSDARGLDQAAAVFWVGPALEGVLAEPLETLSEQARVVALMKAPGIELLPVRAGGAWDEREDEHEHGHGHDEAAETAGDGTSGVSRANPHIWLDPHSARRMVAAIAATLAEVDPAHGVAYRANAARLETRLAALDAALAARLAPIADRPFIVFHDAYQYLEHRYGLNAVGALAVNPAVSPGARRIAELRERVRALGAVCVFAEPQFTPAIIETLIEDTAARGATLDPLGAGLEPGPEAYFELMQRLADDLVACLGPR